MNLSCVEEYYSRLLHKWRQDIMTSKSGQQSTDMATHNLLGY